MFFTSVSPVIALPHLCDQSAAGRFGYHPLLMTCTVVRVNGLSAKKALFLIGFLIPCIAIVICYIGIFLVIVL